MSAPGDAVEAAAAEFAAAYLEGRAPDVDAFCRERAELAPLLRARIGDLLFAIGGLAAGPKAPALAAGCVIGDFRVVRELGRGGMGVVYEAEQLSLGRRIALKVLPAHLTLRPESIERFRREASMAARLKHPGIVEIHAIGEDAGHHFFAMELVEGTPILRTLDAASARGSRRERIETACRLVAEVADALDHAHRAGVVHRDVKPSNVLIRADGRAVLTDFGLAREESVPSITESGELAGTSFYVAPEQVEGRRADVGPRTDVYALGVTLYELLTGRRPFDGRTSQEVLRRIVDEEPVSPERLSPGLPADLATIVLKAMEKEPARRYASARDLAADLRAFLEYRPIAARRASGLRRAERWARRKPAAAALIAVLAVVVPALAALGGYVVAKRGEIRAAEHVARAARVERAVEGGFLCMAERDFNRALAEFDRALRDAPESAEAVAGVAMARSQRGDAALAIAWLDAHAREARDHPELERVRVDALLHAGRFDEAAARSRELDEPRSPLDLFVAGAIEAARAERETPGAADRAVALLSRAVRLSAPRALFHFERAYAAGLAKDARAARECSEAIEAFWPASARGHYWRGFALHSVDRDAAMAAYARALELEPAQALAHVNLAILRAESGDLPSAIAGARRACELAPDLAKARYTLANLLQSSGDLDAAVASYRRALELDPSDARSHSQLGIALQQSGDAAGALAAMKRAAELDPENPARHHNLGNVLAAQGELVSAAAEFRRAIELRPRFAPALVSLGNVLLMQGDRAAGIVRLQRAVEADPADPGAHQSLIRALRDAGEALLCRSELERWTEARPRDPRALHSLARFLADPAASGDQHDPAGAVAAAERALALLAELEAPDAKLRAELELAVARWRGPAREVEAAAKR